MRHGIATLLITVCVTHSSHSAVQTPIRGIASTGDVFDIEEAYWDEKVQPPNNWTIIINLRKEDQKEFEGQPCSISWSENASERKFSCASSGTSPLAGTTYVFQEELKECAGTLYVCKDGCSARVPHEMVESPYEGGNCEPEETEE